MERMSERFNGRLGLVPAALIKGHESLVRSDGGVPQRPHQTRAARPVGRGCRFVPGATCENSGADMGQSFNDFVRRSEQHGWYGEA
jgi:hypothetical protein